ncbi:MAG: prohibitin family protein [Candidatus Babeliaceae bacterium]|jgi:regulator of protease activity HflC (stomatin/prohibitin superfamily)
MNYTYHQSPQQSIKPIIFVVGIIGSFLLAILFAQDFFYTVNPGFYAIHTRLGKIIEQTHESGYYFKIPLIDSIAKFDVRIRKAFPDIETKAMSKDLQPVSVGMVVNYKVDDALELFKTIGSEYEKIIIDPFTQESVKAVIAKFTAEDLIQRRHEAKDLVISELAQRLKARHIILIDFNFTHLDFSHDFIKAVEDKQIAEQRAKQAKNLTEKVREEALQSRMRAEAEAFSLKVRKEAVTPELIRLQEIETQAKAIEKWNGVLPTVTGSATPFITLNK